MNSTVCWFNFNCRSTGWLRKIRQHMPPDQDSDHDIQAKDICL